jgi:hypothetical protein
LLRIHGHVGEAGGDRPLWADEPEAVLQTLGAQPATILVDDAHLLDDALLERLVLVAERRGDLGLRMVAARRPGPPSPALARLDGVLLGSGGALHLDPLTVAGVARWLAGEESLRVAGPGARSGRASWRSRRPRMSYSRVAATLGSST